MEKRQDPTLYSEFAGLRNDVDPERFEQQDLAVASNVDLDKSGRIARRAGTTNKLRGPVHSLWAGRSTALFVSGAQLNKLAADFTAILLRDGMTPNARMSYCEVGDRVYFSNGFETGVLEADKARSWGLLVPPTPTVSVTAGTLPAGTYQFAATYMRADGQESGAREAGVITVPEGSGLTFGLTAHPDAAAKNVYLSAPNGDEMYLAATTVGNVALITDLGDQAIPLQTQFMSAPPAGQLVAYFKGRMFVAVEDVLFYSEPFAYELFDLRNYIQLDGRTTMLAVLEEKDSDGSGGMFVSTDKSTGVLVGSGPESFQYVPKLSYGTLLGALDYVDGSLFNDGSTGARPLPVWLSTEGICVGLPGMEIRNLTRTKYGFKAAGEGAALFKPGPNQFIATSNY